MRKTGFTLAEVLITLSIIGVVAALTIAPLMHNFEKMQNKIRFKKEFSTISQAVLMMVADNGGSLDGKLGPDMDNTFCRFLSCTKTCPYADGGAKGLGCWHPNGTSYYFNGHDVENDTTHGGAVLKDGTLMAWYLHDWGTASCTDGSYGCGHLFIDVNGFKGPNIMGRDIFTIQVNANKAVPDGAPDSHNYTWHCEGNWEGFGCAAKVLQNEDY
jgi:prepilin-type N-terminal cleavage/methylation domain-containing protein